MIHTFKPAWKASLRDDYISFQTNIYPLFINIVKHL